MSLVPPSSWLPRGIDDFEPAAWLALKDNHSTCVTAGPGAGKTEFLAQRASYLLETGLCPAPRRILAISFKRDAAYNLGDRVEQRTPDHARRFTSMTFDAFTKQIVDRFNPLLPSHWKLNGDYVIEYARDRDIDVFLNEVANACPPALRPAIDGLSRRNFMTAVVGEYKLPVDPVMPETAFDYAVLEWWRRSYIEHDPPVLDFVMLNRLADLIVRSSAQLRRALIATYPFVFVDEFQDTTYAQYAFMRTLFGRNTIVTAVGDRKQRIMGWAGALSDAFAEYQSDFAATAYTLERNFRTTEPLVQLQHQFAKLLDPDAKLAAAQAVSDIDGEPAAIWSFSTTESEARTIAAYIAAETASSGRSPAEYALVARQKVADFEGKFHDALAAFDIAIRNDDAMVGKMRLQDLLKDGCGRILVGLLRLGATPVGLGGNPQTWIDVSSTVSRLRFGDDQNAVRSAQADEQLSSRLRLLRRWLRENTCSETSANQLSEALTELAMEVTNGRFRSLVDTDDDYEIRIEAFAARLKSACDGASSWLEAVDAYEASEAVSLLTIHRSKGLEYHTVFLLGLDDEQWWAHRRDLETSISTFFVGLSRAAQRIIFTQCDERGGQYNIADLYAVLRDGGVPATRFD